MKFIDFYHHFKDFVPISLADVRAVEPHFSARRLVEWQQKGYLKQLRRGYYILSELADNLGESELFLLANKLYVPSYVSLETMLNRYNFIPEVPFVVTSVTTRKTESFETLVGAFSYRSIKPSLFFGYQLQPLASDRFLHQQCLVALPEKALLDFLYLNHLMNSQLDFSFMRFNKQEIKAECNLQTLQEFITRFNSKALTKRATLFIKWLTN